MSRRPTESLCGNSSVSGEVGIGFVQKQSGRLIRVFQSQEHAHYVSNFDQQKTNGNDFQKIETMVPREPGLSVAL